MAVLFTRSNSDKIDVNSSPVSDTPITVCVFFKSDDLTTRQDVISIVNSGDTSQYVEIRLRGDQAGDFVQARINDAGGGSNAVSGSAYSANVWHSAIATYSSSAQIYLDGVAGAASSTINPGSLDSIGIASRYASNSNYFSGSIAEAVIYARILTLSEIQAIAGGADPREIDGAVFLDQLVTDSYFDEYGGIVLVETNTPATANDHPPVEDAYYGHGGFVESAVSGATGKSNPLSGPLGGCLSGVM